MMNVWNRKRLNSYYHTSYWWPFQSFLCPCDFSLQHSGPVVKLIETQPALDYEKSCVVPNIFVLQYNIFNM